MRFSVTDFITSEYYFVFSNGKNAREDEECNKQYSQLHECNLYQKAVVHVLD